MCPLGGLVQSALPGARRMPHRICPQCHRQGRFLEAASQEAWVDYYRCDVCGHVWAQSKEDPNAPPRDITLPPMTMNR